MRLRIRHLAAVGGLALALTGCQDPYRRDQAHHRGARAPSAAATPSAAGDGDRPGRAAPPLPAAPAAPRSSARAAVAAFAEGWSNWDWRFAAGGQRALARLAVGRLAAQLRSSARSATADASLARDKPSSRGTVVAIDLKLAGGRASGVVVTREQLYTAGHADLGGRHYRVYLARLVRAGGGWGVSAWAPQQ